MQWILVTINPETVLPEPGEQVLGLWLGGFWKKVMYSPDVGWYTSRDGVEQAAPTWWCRVDTTVAKQLPPQGEIGPKGEEGPLGPDASVMERVRKFLEQLIEVRDTYSADLELRLPPEYCGKYECYDDWAADGAAKLLQMISLMSAPTPSPITGSAETPLLANTQTDVEYLRDLSERLFTAASPLTDQADCDKLDDIAARLADDAGE